MLVVISLVLLAAAPPARPTAGAIRRAFEAGKAALVEVDGKRGTELGMVVGNQGQVLSRVDASLDTVRVHAGDKVYSAQVQTRQRELGMAVLKLEADPPLVPAAMHPGVPPHEGWVIAVQRQKGHPVPLLGKLRKGPASDFLYIDLHVAANTPVLDVQGRLLGWAIADTRQGAKLLSIPALQAQLASPDR
jgi:hypothetical protein